MIHSSILNAIVNGVFAIDANHVKAYLPILLSAFAQGKIKLGDPDEFLLQQFTQINQSYCIKTNEDRLIRAEKTDSVDQPAIYVMQLRGIVAKYSYPRYGMIGTAELMAEFTSAMRDPMVSAVLFIADSPGGDVDGTFEFADAIKRVKEEEGKPVVGFIDGKACSGAYAILSPMDTILASHATATAGSVGVYMSWMSMRKMLEKHGIEIHTVIAPNSPEKIKAFMDAEEKGNDAMLKEKLRVLQDIFQATVRSGRPDIAESALLGDSYFGEKATELGLIDGIATLEEAVNYTYSLTQNS